MQLRLIFALVACAVTGCAIEPLRAGPPASPGRGVNPVVAPAVTVAPLSLPQPPAQLPRPYAGADVPARTPEERDYAEYLRSTALLPDVRLCDEDLSARLMAAAMPGTVNRDWVTKPFLAWGGEWEKGAVVGPVQHLYAITEAHVTWQDLRGQERRSTYSCYVQYALWREAVVWRAGHVKHGSYMSDGHKKYQSGPASQPFAVSLPGSQSGWEPGVRYYRPD